VTLAGVALAAGRGVRMRPLTDDLPKVLMPVAGVPLLDLALDRLADHVPTGPDTTAVNAHHLADQVARRVGDRAHLSLEQPQALGTAGALGRLREWLDGRDVLVTNADVYHPGRLTALMHGAGDAPGWDGERCRLLVTAAEPGRRADFRLPDGSGVRYVGSCLLPWPAVRRLAAAPSGLYEVLWRELADRGELDLVSMPSRPDDAGLSIDCGTPADYLAANLHACGGHSSVAPGAVVEGTVERCVVWDGAWVAPHEHLRDVIRAGTRQRPVTVDATVGS
jgi:N-acetyl-alpha-D-muramate 1-phosphate uridylyltransferase